MAYDGIVVAATVKELNEKLLGGSLAKVAQPGKEELLFTVKVNRSPLKLCISANASVPMVCLKEDSTLSQLNASAFCMLLRKHIGGGRLLKIEQAPGLERVIIFTVEHMNELGDRGEKLLIAELMGKHSNIILAEPDGTIIDAIKHVSALTSTVREVLPGRKWFLPETSHHGLGKVMDNELYIRSGLDRQCGPIESDVSVQKKMDTEKEMLLKEIEIKGFHPNIIYRNEKAVDFAAIPLLTYSGKEYRIEYHDSISEVVRTFYEKKEIQSRVHAKSEDVRMLLKNLTERTAKKLDLQEKQYKDTENREKYRIYGELLNTYGYGLEGGEKSFTCQNFYDDYKEVTIPLDEHKSAQENAEKYFDKYQKLKRTAKALEEQVRENTAMLYHLDSLRNSLFLCENEADLNEIRKEMAEAGYIRKNNTDSKAKIRREEQRSAPLHFLSTDGIDIYVGRNNEQNEELDFKFAEPEDWWFHAKKVPGSHVIVKTGKKELPDKTCMEAASLAAYYSKPGRDGMQGLIEIDYVKRKELKKVSGAPKGFVIYHTNYSMLAEPKEKI